MSFKLSARLKMICGLVDKCHILADVGCDHAYASMYLTKQGIAEKIYASDLREGPLKKAAENIKAEGLDGQIETVLCDGLKGLKTDADCILISGMGGILMSSILRESAEKTLKAGRLVLSPQSDRAYLRRTVSELGFSISDEDDCFDDGKYYQCIAADRSGSKEMLDDLELEYGKILIGKKSENLYRYLTGRKEKMDKIRAGLPHGSRGLPAEFDRELEMINRALEKIKLQ